MNSDTASQAYHQLSRVEVNMPSGVPIGAVLPFEVLVPVKPIVKLSMITMFIATLAYHS